MKKIVYLLLFTTLFTSCELVHGLFNPCRAYQKDFETKYLDPNLKSSTLSSLFNCRGTSWDEVVYYGPYHDVESVERDLGFTIPYISNSYNDGDWLLVFIDKYNENNVLKHFIFGSRYEIDTVWNVDKNYSRDDLFEVVERENYARRIKILHKDP